MVTLRHRPLAAWFAAALLSLASGCGGSGLVTVAGKVVFEDGEPVRTGRIEFRRSSPDSASAAGSTATAQQRAVGVLDAEGRFRLRNDDGEDGCPPGDYDVVIVQLVSVEHRSLKSHNHGRPLPRKYADYYTSGLKATVPEAGIEGLVLEVSSGDDRPSKPKPSGP